MHELRTERLRLRDWRDADYEPFAALNGDPETMRYFPATLSRSESDLLADRIRDLIADNGWGLWAVQVAGAAPFIGFVGLNAPAFEAHFTPAVEIGWRLARAHWRNGYATEAATAALAYGFAELGLDEIVSFTAEINQPSIGVMRKLGMRRDAADDFDHPAVAAGPLRRHVLFRAQRPR